MTHSEPLSHKPQFVDYRVGDPSMENEAEILCTEEEGTNRTMTCNAVNAEPREIGTSEAKKTSHLKYTMDIKDDKKLISCIVNNQAFGGAFYNRSFMPQKARENSVQARMDVQFKAQAFKLVVLGEPVKGVKLPFKP